MTVKLVSERFFADLASAAGYYGKKVRAPDSSVIVADHFQDKVIVENNTRIKSASPSFTASFSSSSLGGAVETVAASDANGSKYIQSGEEANQQKTRKLSLDEYLQAFRRASRSDVLEYGMVSKCDDLLSSWFDESPVQVGSIINHIFIQSMGDKNILLSLLKAISNLSYDSIYPFGQTVAVAALVNRDVEVSEGGIRAFENWGSPAGISVLENTKLAFEWLETYRQQTIVYLRDI